MTGQSESETDVIDIKDIDSIPKKEKKKKCVQQFVCSYDGCKEVFKRLYRLNRHIRQHTGERPFVCPIEGCLRSFTCKTYLSKHVKRPHNTDSDNKIEKPILKSPKQYVCSECQKCFKTKFQLRIHCYQHSGLKPFECQKCDKRFATQTKLKSHTKTHDGYACGREGCDYKSFKWSELRKHISVSHKISFKCEVCHKTFINGYNLNLHKEVIHLDTKDKFVCSYDNCGQSYYRKSSLKTHMRTKHEKKMLNCPQEGCLLTFLHKKSLKHHIENHSKPKPEKTDSKPKKIRRKVSKASKLTGVELEDKQRIQLMEKDRQFREDFGQK